jgi:hypothetical protein
MRKLVGPVVAAVVAVLAVGGFALAQGKLSSSPVASSGNSAGASAGGSSQPTAPGAPPAGAKHGWHLGKAFIVCPMIGATPSSSAPSPTPSASYPLPHRGHCGCGPLATDSQGPEDFACVFKGGPWGFGLGWVANNVAHADAIVRVNGAWQTFAFDQGTIGATSSASLTIDRLDGAVVTVALSPQTRFRGLPQDQLAQGERVAVVSQGGTAVYVFARAPKPEASTTTTAA